MIQILIATANKHKAGEITAMLPKGPGYKTLSDFPKLVMPEENGKTLEENAILKAVSAAGQSGLYALADDTGLEVDALDGAPGVYSARYSGKERDYTANNAKLLAELAKLPKASRAAKFRTVVALSAPDGKVLTEEGRLDGMIGFLLHGENGFGYDPLFVLQDGRTLAELTFAEKNSISHRRVAMAKIAPHIKKLC